MCTGEVRKCQTPDIMKKPNTKRTVQGGIAGRHQNAEGRGTVEFEPTDSASDKPLVYRLLVHDKIITPSRRNRC